MEDAEDQPVAAPADGRHGEEGGERDQTDADGGSDARGGDRRTIAAALDRAWRRGPRSMALAIGLTAVAMLIGGLAIASRADDDTASPARTRPHPPTQRSSTTTVGTASTASTSTTTTTLPTTTTSAPTVPTPPSTSTPPASASASSSGGSTPPETAPAPTVASRTTCGLAPWPSSGGTLPTVPVAPGQSAAYGPPTAACTDVAQGCSVSFTLQWSDGFTETRHQVLSAPGSYTLSGDRGTTWTFAVSSDLYCSSSGGTYSSVWPSGA